MWGEVLGVEGVGAGDNFFELGGDSMLSLRVSTALDRLGYHLPINALLSGASLAELAANAVQPKELIEAAPVEGDDYPATPLQLGMLAAGPEYYHDVFTYRIPLPHRLSLLRTVLREVSNRHPALRTWFDLGELPPMACVAPDHEPAVHVVTEVLPADERTRTVQLREFRARETRSVFPEGVPPLRFVIHEDPDPDAFFLTLSFHHALLDGWSVARLIDEIARRYAQRLTDTDTEDAGPAPHLMPRYAASVQAALRSPETLRFWQEEARRARSVLPAETNRAAFDQAVHVLDRDVVERITDLARQLRCGARTLFLAVLLQVLAELDQTDTVTVGTVTHGRPAVDGAEKALGLFLNTVPLTITLTDPELAAVVANCQAREALSHPHRDFPYAQTRKLIGGDLRYNVNYTHFASRAADGLYGQYGGAGFVEHTDLPVLISVSQDVAASAVRIRVATTVADPTRSPKDLLDAYVKALRATVPSPEGTQPALVDEHGVLAFAGSVGDTSHLGPAHLLFEQCADRHPDAPAVLFGQTMLTYGELETRANQVAWVLRTMGVGRGSLVGVCLPRGTDMIAAVIGIHKAGGAYVPLDPKYPVTRLAFIVADAGVDVVLSFREAPEFGVPVVLVDAPEVFAGVSGERPECVVTGLDAAYVLYTSGSTGQPKGVLVQHDSCANLIAWARDQRAGLATSTLMSTSLNFDLSVYEIWLPLTSGGWTRVVEDILVWGIEDHSTEDMPAVINTVPSLLDQVLRETDIDLRGTQVNLAGEPTPPRLLQECLDRGADGVFNLYGPTEATVYALWARQEVGNPQVIGRPLVGSRVVVVGVGGGLVGVGVVGELWVGGV
ncbi:AMP-binding protein, partial [Actinocrispum wychmicini]|uniref:AMP-binding protein n=1 Tax=Actinocrispum wychmicini TaxID=1213861 RepID=UPI001FB86089